MLLLAFAAVVFPSHLPPVDRCASDPSFVQFRRELRRTIAKRDAKALLVVVADDVHASLGGDFGKKDFVKLWGLERPRSSRVWDELGTALRLGCSIQGGIATSPSFEDQIGSDRDPFETLVALPESALRRRPNDNGAVVARLRWDVLTIRGTREGGPWVAVRLDDGRRGFVRRNLTRSPIDYRAWFDRRSGRWRMAGFLNGD